LGIRTTWLLADVSELPIWQADIRSRNPIPSFFFIFYIYIYILNTIFHPILTCLPTIGKNECAATTCTNVDMRHAGREFAETKPSTDHPVKSWQGFRRILIIR
jgi:hypothetical protein